MSYSDLANGKESTSAEMVAVAPVEPITIRRYFVPIVADVQLTLTGDFTVYAKSEDEAIKQVQAKIDDDMLDDLEMEDVDSVVKLRYVDLKWCDEVAVAIDTFSVRADDLDEVTEEDMLRADVDDLEARISWGTEALSKRKDFLKTLIESESAAT